MTHKRALVVLIMALTGVLCVLLALLLGSRAKNDALEPVVPRDVTSDLVVEAHTPRCLQEYEEAHYEITNKRREQKGEESYVSVTVTDTRTGATTSTFKTPILQPTHYHPVEIHRCGVYLVSGINFDPDSSKKLQGYSAWLSAVDYDGITRRVFLVEENATGAVKDYKTYYSRDFRSDGAEEYISFIQGFYGSEKNPDQPQEYALVIKPLDATSTNVFYLPHKDVIRDDLLGHFGFLEWSADGRYFWAELSDGAIQVAWIRIDSSDWSYEVFETPEGVLGGYGLNIETGWVPLIPGAIWTGVDISDQAVWEERKAGGEKAALYVYNIFTKEKRLVRKTDAPV